MNEVLMVPTNPFTKYCGDRINELIFISFTNTDESVCNVLSNYSVGSWYNLMRTKAYS